MRSYENGESTRRLIIQTAARLFYENGFDKTHMDDICRTAHLQRSSVYYHFKNKGEILLKVLQELICINQKNAEKYCPVVEFWYTLSMAILWEQFIYDAKIRRMLLQWINLNPNYSSGDFLFPVHTLCYQPFSDIKLSKEDVRELSAVSTYGLVVHTAVLAGEKYDAYTPEELTYFCMSNTGRVYGVEDSAINAAWNEILPYLRRLPMDELRKYPFT